MGAEKYLPRKLDATLARLHRAADKCRGCDLYKRATQVVFGEVDAARGEDAAQSASIAAVPIMLVGEQPGDQEDLAGHPFVGPAGKMLDRALDGAGIDRAKAYVTNAVKHFKWTPAPRGVRRIHSKPNAAEVHACRPWLEREVLLINPQVVVCLGATAGQALLGPKFRVGAMRGKDIAGWEGAAEFLAGRHLVATIHPSAILRSPDKEGREREFRGMVKDLAFAKKLLTRL